MPNVIDELSAIRFTKRVIDALPLALSDYLFDLLSRRAENRQGSRSVFPGEEPSNLI